MEKLLLVLALARILAGETQGCPVEAKIAFAHVHENRIEQGIEGGWFGDDDPAAADLAVAMIYQSLPDLSEGALYAIGPGDWSKMWWLEEQTATWVCDDGRHVATWK